jgi:hypothetical protein
LRLSIATNAASWPMSRTRIATPTKAISGYGLALADGSLLTSADRAEAHALIESETRRWAAWFKTCASSRGSTLRKKCVTRPSTRSSSPTSFPGSTVKLSSRTRRETPSGNAALHRTSRDPGRSERSWLSSVSPSPPGIS